MLVSITVLIVILGILFLLTDVTSKTWKRTTTKIDAFQSARAGFEELTRVLSQATLNTYYNYYYVNGANTVLWTSTVSGPPTKYDRYSEMHFICGPLTTLLPTAATWSGDTPPATSRPTQGVFFQAPLGYTSNSIPSLDRVLNACGFYVEYNSDKTVRPSFLQNTGSLRYRYRLMQLLQPSQNLEIYRGVYDTTYSQFSGFSSYSKWFQDAVGTSSNVRPLAENIIALILYPEVTPADSANPNMTQLTTNYMYDSWAQNATPSSVNHSQFNQLPPMIQVTMVAIDEPSAVRLCTSSTPYSFLPAGSFSTVGSLTDPTQPGYAQDLSNLKASLTALHVNFRIFSTDVTIPGSKWTTD